MRVNGNGRKHPLEKLNDAIYCLVTGPYDVRQRLLSAFEYIRLIEKKHLPDYLVKDFQWVLNQLNKFGPTIGKDGKVTCDSVTVTLGRIKNKTGSKIAERILNIYKELYGHYMEIDEKP